MQLKPDARLLEALKREPLKSSLLEWLNDARRHELERLSKVPSETDFRAVQGRAQMLAEIISTIEK